PRGQTFKCRHIFAGAKPSCGTPLVPSCKHSCFQHFQHFVMTIAIQDRMLARWLDGFLRRVTWVGQSPMQ
ncbi:MAG: hypothetical protein AAF394_10205, partial [Planctomycetota bacterium]